MDERGAAGFTLVVREILSGPRQLTEAVSTQALTLNCLPSSDGGAEVGCAQLEQPVKHRVGATVDPHRYHPDYLGRDESGMLF